MTIIDKIIPLHLERCQMRRWAFLGAASSKNVPLDLIYFNRGKDNRDWKDDIPSIIEAASADGFPFLERFGRGNETEYVHQTAGTLCQAWNYCRIFRYLAEKDETALVIHDDRMLTVDFDLFYAIASELKQADREFYAWQTTIRGHTNEAIAEEPDQALEHNKEVFDAIVNNAIRSHTIFVQLGLIGYEETMLISGAGASWILQCLEAEEDIHSFYDYFICNTLSVKAKDAIERGKGIYCPRRPGYKFTCDFLEMGTLTSWAPVGSHHYEESMRTVCPTFLEDIE